MHGLRLPYFRLAPEAYKTLYALSDRIGRGALDKKLVELVYLRVSQMNGCAFCLDMHATALRGLGEDAQRMDVAAGWRECSLFSEAERAALDWAETLTRIGDGAPEDAQFDALKQHFSDAQIAELTFAVATINAWNRIAVSMQQPIERRTS